MFFLLLFLVFLFLCGSFIYSSQQRALCFL